MKKSDITEEQQEFFWSKVGNKNNASECWPWLGAKKYHGYGNVRINKKAMLSHRVAFTLANFDIPDGFIVCHSCDNPQCCNPGHLMVGRSRSNTVDMITKGRDGFKKNRATGIRNPNAKISFDQVCEIRKRYAAGGKTQRDLAKEYNMTQSAISAIILHKTRNEC